MHVEPGNIYHVYNRGNQQQTIFFKRDHYMYFLEKCRKYIAPRCEILCWCLMPNHFHFLVYANEQSASAVPGATIPIQQLSEGIRLLLSSYAKGIQQQRNKKGNLFQQKTKAKMVSHMQEGYAATAFHYIHQNPYNAKLVSKIEDWEFSSFRDYTGIRNGNLCNKRLAVQLLDLDLEHFYKAAYSIIPENNTKDLF